MPIPQNALHESELAISHFMSLQDTYDDVDNWRHDTAKASLEAALPYLEQPVSVQHIKAQHTLIGLIEKEANVKWADKQGQIRTGTLRRIDTPHDLTHANVQITMHPGTQIDMPFSDLTELIHDGRLAESTRPQPEPAVTVQPTQVAYEALKQQQANQHNIQI